MELQSDDMPNCEQMFDGAEWRETPRAAVRERERASEGEKSEGNG